MISNDEVKNALRSVKYPGYSRDIVSFGLVKNVSIKDGAVNVAIEFTAGTPEIFEHVRAESARVLKALPGVAEVTVEIKAPAAAQAGAAPNQWQGRNRIPGIKRVVAIASGKGGVGKSTTAVNLACALRHLGATVGLLDCDIYGPSIPLMMGTRSRPTVTEDDQMMIPPVSHGVKLMSIGFLLDGDAPVIWRGPMIMKTIQQFVTSVSWGDLDYLLVDLPPGTGDAQLSLCQTVPLDGGVVVTTPQEASLGVVRRGIAMFQKVNVPILGIIENMSYFTTPNGERVEIFGHGGGHDEAIRQNVTFLGEVPIFTEIRESGDKGVPIVVAAPDSTPGRVFIDIATKLRGLLDLPQ
jgi:ATP-binding protein involved in chromosome partitioning